MLKIKNNNIQCISPKGKIYFTHFHWLKDFIWCLKHTVETIKIDLRDTLEYKIIGYNDGVVVGNKNIEVRKITTSKPLGDEYFNRLKAALEDGKEIKISDWKFKLI